MVVLSARFAILACLCAALPLALPPAVEAAHVYGSNPMNKHAFSTYPLQRTRTRSSSFFGGPTATYIHDGKNSGHQVSILFEASRLFACLRPLCRHQTTEPRNFRPFCDAIASIITTRFKISTARVLTATPITKSLGLLSHGVAIAVNLLTSVVVPRYMSRESMATRILSLGHHQVIGCMGTRVNRLMPIIGVKLMKVISFWGGLTSWQVLFFV